MIAKGIVLIMIVTIGIKDRQLGCLLAIALIVSVIYVNGTTENFIEFADEEEVVADDAAENATNSQDSEPIADTPHASEGFGATELSFLLRPNSR